MLMVLTLLACPLVCKQGLCGAYCAVGGAHCAIGGAHRAVAVGDDVMAKPSCCHECSSLRGSETAPVQSPPARLPCDHCQGICGGAIAVDSVELEGALRITAAGINSAVDALLAPSCLCAATSLHAGRPDRDEPNELHQLSGRALRCLYGSLLL